MQGEHIGQNLRNLQVNVWNYDDVRKVILVFVLTLHCKA